jgi:hypothetical protein
VATCSHDRSHFFKYATFETARRVIESKSFRWSSPVKFNDPFDHQSGFVLKFQPEEFARLLFESTERLIFSQTIPALTPDSLLSQMILALRTLRERLPRAKFLEQMRKGCDETARRICAEGIPELNAEVQAVLCHSRVFCVSELHDNVVMWSHYADEHRGVVFKLRCLDQIDNALLAARKVNYTQSFLAFPDAEKYVRHLTGEERFDYAPLCMNIAFAKHADWAYEREWRVHLQLVGELPGDGHSIYKEDPRVFEEIYLGCRMEEGEVDEMVGFVRQHLPTMKVFQARKSATAFSLEFRETPLS